jgi:hypothetical protein
VLKSVKERERGHAQCFKPKLCVGDKKSSLGEAWEKGWEKARNCDLNAVLSNSCKRK